MSIRAVIETIRDGLLSVSYPSRCRLCDSAVETWDDGVICRACWLDPNLTWTFELTHVCSRCGNPLSPSFRSASTASDQAFDSSHRLCGLCAESRLAASRSCGAYKGGLEASVLFLKSSPHICPRLKRLIVASVQRNTEFLGADIVEPIPLHPVRLKERGFNQAALIARTVSKSLSVPLRRNILIRTKQTRRHRAGMDPLDRAQSVERAFSVTKPEEVRNRSVLLVDDVYTTGATVGQAADVLLKAGASSVKCFTIARVVLPYSSGRPPEPSPPNI